MEITINGQARMVPEACTLNDLLALQAVEPEHVVVEINRTIVPKETFSTLRIGPGDRVEILSFVGGG
jgi:thiamine biosynthesis protein ThiS